MPDSRILLYSFILKQITHPFTQSSYSAKLKNFIQCFISDICRLNFLPYQAHKKNKSFF